MLDFIALGRALGKSYKSEESVLRCFDRFIGSYTDPPRHLSNSIIMQWFNAFPKWNSGYRYKCFSIIRNFCVYLCRFDFKSYVPPSTLCPPPRKLFIPYIYSRSEIASLLKAFSELEPSPKSCIRPQRFYTIILLLYTTGMRISEVLNLQLRDIDYNTQTLCIRRTKFYKSRLIPLSLSMMEKLEVYLKLREGTGVSNSPDAYLFQNTHTGRPYSKASVEEPFRRILQRLNIKFRQGPRLHDLRATFAVHRLEEWYQQGVEIQAKIGLLSTYLGHVDFSSTQRYVPMTAELLDQASHRFEKYFK